MSDLNLPRESAELWRDGERRLVPDLPHPPEGATEKERLVFWCNLHAGGKLEEDTPRKYAQTKFWECIIDIESLEAVKFLLINYFTWYPGRFHQRRRDHSIRARYYDRVEYRLRLFLSHIPHPILALFTMDEEIPERSKRAIKDVIKSYKEWGCKMSRTRMTYAKTDWWM